jgi:hypothetical protein
MPQYLAFTNQLPETLLAENLLQKRLVDTGIEILPATLSNIGASPLGDSLSQLYGMYIVIDCFIAG